MKSDQSRPRLAVAQATPVLFDPSQTSEKAVSLIRQASASAAELILLPEAFVPGYPRGIDFGTTVGARSELGREIYRMLWETAVEVPGPVTDSLSAAARETGIYVAVGIVERMPSINRSLFCSLLVFDDQGQIVLHHRKLRPTGAERLIWGEGDGSTLKVLQTPFGRIGGLICWENYMPLARAALYAQSVEIYLAPTADARDSWQATLSHIACEGRCFVLGCNQFVRRADYPDFWKDLPGVRNLPEIACRGGSAVYSPFGERLAGPVYDCEELIIVDIDPNEVILGKFDFDVAGHYARPDVFQLSVNKQVRMTVDFDRLQSE